jgi:hypothetical protein
MVSPAVAAALAERAQDDVDACEIAAVKRHGADAREANWGLAAVSDGALLSRRQVAPTVGAEFAITRELRRRFIKSIGGA